MASYNQALQILREIGVKKDYGDILINRGVLYQTRGDYDKALQDYKDALQIQRDAGDVNYQAFASAISATSIPQNTTPITRLSITSSLCSCAKS